MLGLGQLKKTISRIKAENTRLFRGGEGGRRETLCVVGNNSNLVLKDDADQKG